MVKKQVIQLSWTSISLFMQCPCCFYLSQKIGKKRPGPDDNLIKLSKAVDKQLKNEFDLCRREQKNHQIIIENKIDALPFYDINLIKKWRDPFRKDGQGGVRFFDKDLDLILYGAIDDVLTNAYGELIVVDFKATSKKEPIIYLNNSNQWHELYKRQLSFYARLLRQNNYKVCDIGYFIFCQNFKNADKINLNQPLEFETNLVSCKIDDSWMDDIVKKARNCWDQSEAPVPSLNCSFCIRYFK